MRSSHGFHAALKQPEFQMDVKGVGEVGFVARSPKVLPKFCLFLCEPGNHPSWTPHVSKQEIDEYVHPFQLANVP